MAKLIFFDDEHKYQLDGEELPSVSEITRFISREVYGDVRQFNLDNAAERGTAVHKACEILDKYGKAEITDDIVNYVKAYVQFLKDYKPEWEKIEFAIHHSEHGYAGTIDRYGTIGGEKCLVDIKSSYKVQKALYGAGQNLYRMALEENGYQVDRIYILHLIKDGTYKLIELEKSDDTALACLTLHNALKTKKRKKKETK